MKRYEIEDLLVELETLKSNIKEYVDYLKNTKFIIS